MKSSIRVTLEIFPLNSPCHLSQSPWWAPLLLLILQLLLVCKDLDFTSLRFSPWVISCYVFTDFFHDFQTSNPNIFPELQTHFFAYQIDTSNIVYRKSLSSLNQNFVFLQSYLNEWHCLPCRCFDSFPFLSPLNLI